MAGSTYAENKQASLNRNAGMEPAAEDRKHHGNSEKLLDFTWRNRADR
jgi:hypothetical protein